MTDRDDDTIAGLLGPIRDQIVSREAGRGTDWPSQDTVRAWRDGVPPPVVTGLTVGGGGARKVLAGLVAAACQGQLTRPVFIEAEPGDGRSHFISWTAELASTKGLAVSRVSTEAKSDLALQHVLLRSTRIRGRLLADLLQDPSRPPPSEAHRALKSVAEAVTPFGQSALEMLWGASAQGNFSKAKMVLDCLEGGASPAEMRALGLKGSPIIGDGTRGVVSACVAIARLFGASGLAMLSDADRKGGEAQEDAQHEFDFRIARFLIAATSPFGPATVAPVSPLTVAERVELGLMIGRHHVRAFDWPRAAHQASDQVVEDFVLEFQDGSTRDLVRGVVARLDALLTSQEASLGSWEERYVSVAVEGGHRQFFDRFLSATDVTSLTIVSPWISATGDLADQFDLTIRKIRKEAIPTLVLVRDPRREPINLLAVQALRTIRSVSIYYNDELHAKVYVCRCAPFGFGYVGSANLTGRGTTALEVGVILDGRGAGKRIVDELWNVGHIDLMGRAGTRAAHI